MKVAEHIERATDILIIGHQRPDGDCIGAGLALRTLCRNRGKACDFLVDSPLPAHYAFMPEFEAMNKQTRNEYDLVICVDCADEMRAGRYIGYLKKAKNSLNIDHHITNTRYATENFVQADASSTCEILTFMLYEAGEIDETIATLLYVGLSTDTGHFMHSNVTPRVYAAAQILAEHGADSHEIASKLYKNATYAKVKLIGRAISSMHFYADGKICVIGIHPEDLTACGCVLADTEGLIDYGMMIESVEVAVCITELDKLQCKVSYRSKGLDVAAAAAVFGGGGHKLAAGCSLSGRYEDVVQKVVKSVADGMPL